MSEGVADARLRLSGPVTRVSSTGPLVLSDPHTVWVVTAGELVVFAVEEAGPTPGRRHFVTSVGPGEVFVGIEPAHGLEVIGSGTAETEVRAEALAAVEDSAEGRALVAAWAERSVTGAQRHARDHDAALEPEDLAIEADGLVRTVGARVLALLDRHLRAQKVAEEARLLAAVAREDQVDSRAVSRLSGVLSAPRDEAVPVADDPLLEACRSAASRSGITIVVPEDRSTTSWRSAMRDIAKTSQVRVRRVTLDDGWWRTDSGPMVAVLDGDRPVALVPTGSRKYQLVDHGTGERRVVDAQVASRLDREAFVFYAAWSATPLKARQVLAMGLRGTRADLLRIAGFGLATSLLALMTPLATAALFNEVIPNAARGRLLALVGALVLGALAAAALQLAQGVALVRFQSRVNASLGAALWDRILRLPMRFFRQYSIGDLAARTQAFDAIRQILAQNGLSIVLSSVFSLSSVALLFFFDASLAVVGLLLLAVSVGVTTFLTTRQVRRQRELVALRGDVSALVVQQVVGVSKLRVTASERRAFGEWADLYARQQRAMYAAGQLRNLQTAFNAGWAPFTTLVIFWWLSRRDLGAIDAGTFLAFFAAFGQVLVASRAITDALGSMLQVVPLYERAKPILAAAPEVVPSAQDPGALTGRVEVNHVDFRYEEDGPLILRDVSITVEPGEFIALVGPSGAGKSSLIRLLLGFDQPAAGTVLFDGQDLGTLDIELVRRQIGVVLQTAQLMPGSILTNIVGETDLTRDDAWRAAVQAGLDADLRAMPMGMDTLITEGSSTLSGGQRQRLLIARALAAAPRLLLFDEATSALDNLTQQTVTESLDRLAVTRIVIAHRLSTVVNADKIVVMERGRVVEVGTYDQLMAAGGSFAALAARQIV